MKILTIILCAIILPLLADNSGIDASHYQGLIDWKLLKDKGVDFAIVKATEGMDIQDPDFNMHRQNAGKEGIVTGFYHFYYADDHPLLQAQNYLNTVGTFQKDDLIPILDIEYGSIKSSKLSKPQIRENIKDWLKAIERATNKKPIIYTTNYFAKELGLDETFSQYPLWIADYQAKSQPEVPQPWKEKSWDLWQKTPSYHIGSTKYDFDLANPGRSIDEFKMKNDS